MSRSKTYFSGSYPHLLLQLPTKYQLHLECPKGCSCVSLIIYHPPHGICHFLFFFFDLTSFGVGELHCWSVHRGAVLCEVWCPSFLDVSGAKVCNSLRNLDMPSFAVLCKVQKWGEWQRLQSSVCLYASIYYYVFFFLVRIALSIFKIWNPHFNPVAALIDKSWVQYTKMPFLNQVRV